MEYELTKEEEKDSPVTVNSTGAWKTLACLGDCACKQIGEEVPGEREPGKTFLT